MNKQENIHLNKNISLLTDDFSTKMSVPQIIELALSKYYKEQSTVILCTDEIFAIAIRFYPSIKNNIDKKSAILTDYCYNLVNECHFKKNIPNIRKKKPSPFLLSVKFLLKDVYSSPSELNEIDGYYVYVGLDYMFTGSVWKKREEYSNHCSNDGYYICGAYKSGKFISFEEKSHLEIIQKNDILKNKVLEAKEYFTTEVLGDIVQRLGQERFRDKLLNFWNNTCSLSGIKQLEVLRASHIKPWAQSDDSERMNPYNGLLLSANYDALFDRGLISFDENGKILISKDINDSDRAKLGLSITIKLNNKYCKHHEEFMKYHRSYIFKN